MWATPRIFGRVTGFWAGDSTLRASGPASSSTGTIFMGVRILPTQTCPLHRGRNLRVAHEPLPDAARAQVLGAEERDAESMPMTSGLTQPSVGWNASANP